MKDIRKLLEKNIREKNIVIWGAGVGAQKFYKQYKDKCNITACVVSGGQSPEYLMDEMPVVPFSEYEIKENDFFVVYQTPYARCENQLEAMGFTLLEDFVECYIADFVMSGKKLALIAGNCQLVMMFDFLKEVKAFTDEYYMVRFSTHYWKSKWSLKSISIVKNMCDLYVNMYHEEGDTMFYMPEELPKYCKRVTIPYIAFRLYWPQMSISDGDFFIKSPKTKAHGPFEMADKNINRMIKAGKDVEEIYRVISSKDYYSGAEIMNMLEAAFTRWETMEEHCDVKLMTYIKENYKTEHLYRDMLHMQPDLICEMTRQLLCILGLNADELKKIMREKSANATYAKYATHCTEVPVYPSVIGQLGLQWCDEDTRWDVNFYSGTRKLNFKEYVYEYYRVCKLMKSVQDEW